LEGLLLAAELDPEHLAEQLRQPRRQAEQCGGDRGVGDPGRSHPEAGERFQVVLRRVQDGEVVVVEQHIELRQRRQGDRVQQHAVVVRTHLDQRGPAEVAVRVGPLDIDTDHLDVDGCEPGPDTGGVVHERDGRRGGGAGAILCSHALGPVRSGAPAG